MDVDRSAPASVALEFDAVFNLRDLGGHVAADGGVLRHGVLFRADGLFRLSERDLERFATLGIRDVVDLRRPDEVSLDGRIAELPGVNYHNLCLQTAAWTSVTVAAGQLPRFLADRYAEMADEALETGAAGRVLRFLADEPGPTVFHCAAGKDRTGVVAALVLALLGMADGTIAADYAATAGSEEKYLAWRAANHPELPPFETTGEYAPAEAIVTFLAELRDRYGSVVDYVERAGVTRSHRAALRDRLLTDH